MAAAKAAASVAASHRCQTTKLGAALVQKTDHIVHSAFGTDSLVMESGLVDTITVLLLSCFHRCWDNIVSCIALKTD
jgi:hypothetical protein